MQTEAVPAAAGSRGVSSSLGAACGACSADASRRRPSRGAAAGARVGAKWGALMARFCTSPAGFMSTGGWSLHGTGHMHVAHEELRVIER